MIVPVAISLALTFPAPDVDLRARAARSAPAPRRKVKRQRARIVRLAASFIGTPYVWGGSRPGGFDCSGLVQYVYGLTGRVLPRTTGGQRWAGVAARRPLRRGDLVLAYADSHVGIYAGHGTIIVAPHTGSVVQREPISWLPVSHVRRLIRRG